MRGWRMEMGIWWVREGWTRLRGGVRGRMRASMARRYTKFNFGNLLCCYGCGVQIQLLGDVFIVCVNAST